MSNFLAAFFMLLIMGFFIFWSWLTAQQKVDEKPELRDIVDLAFSAGTLLMIGLTLSSLAFFKGIYNDWFMEMQQEVWARNGHLIKNKVTRLHLVIDQFNLIIGTGCLLWMIRDAISLEHFEPSSSKKLDELRVLDEILKRPVVYYWWFIGGLALFFGFSSGKGMVLFLAMEITLMWVIIKAGIIATKIKHRKNNG